MRGWFGERGRPYIDCRIVLPLFGLDERIDFLIDTGADRTTIAPFDTETLGIDVSMLRRRAGSVGVGGQATVYREPAFLIFDEPGSNGSFMYVTVVSIMPPNPAMDSIPSLLGRDILNRWAMAYNAESSLLSFEVLSADTFIPSRRG